MDRVTHPIVYLPIEFRSREFDSKALLAAVLAQRGYAVVLGQQWMVNANLDRLPPGVVLYKSFNRIHHPAMQQAKRAGHRVIALEEELLAQTEERVVKMLCPQGIFESADLFLCHGQFELDILRRLSGGRARIEIAGNGRVDLLKPAARAFFQRQIDELRLRHGEFILVNTNFSAVNSVWQSVERVRQVEIDAGFLDPSDAAAMKRWDDFIAYEGATRDVMHGAIRELARRRPAQKIIVRPHPGEDLAGWTGVFADAPNVQIVREGSHVPWTLACRLLLHSSCTTGFEAHIAGQTALSLVPRRGWNSDSLLSNRVNPVFADPAELVAAVERVLDGAAPPAARPATPAPEHFVWNYRENDGALRTAELVCEQLPPPGPVSIPALANFSRNEVLKNKFAVSLEECTETFERIAAVMGGSLERLEVRALGDSLFVVTPPGLRQSVSVAPPQADYAELRATIEGACQGGNFQKAYDLFRQNFATTQRHADLCFFAGIALFEMGKHALALQYLQHACLAGGAAVDPNISFWLARTHQRLGEIDAARSYAEQAYRQVPLQPGFFDLFKELALRAGKEVPEHWIVIGCSHVRYFRYLQLNQPKFFKDRVHLECYEFGGATAYGLGNPNSQAGALNATRQIRPRLAQADRILVQFGEVDCRRAAWKAAAVSGRSIEETIAESVVQLESYLRREVLPHNKSVLVLGAKPQIVGDEDFYKVAAADVERIVFKPIEERERITVSFNAQLRQAAQRLSIEYADLHHVVADEKSRKQFFKKVYWDAYTTDTHGSVDYLARLYFERLQEFVG